MTHTILQFPMLNDHLPRPAPAPPKITRLPASPTHAPHPRAWMANNRLLKTRATVDVFELIKTEFTFYNTVMREMVPFVVPKVFYADMNFRSNNACMVLEKVKGEFRDQLEQPATIEDARIIVTKMAQLGAKWNGK